MGSEALVNGHHHGPSNSLLRNDKSKPWIVQKFGGTSVGKFPDQIADKIVKYAIMLLHAWPEDRMAKTCKNADFALQGKPRRLSCSNCLLCPE